MGRRINYRGVCIDGFVGVWVALTTVIPPASRRPITSSPMGSSGRTPRVSLALGCGLFDLLSGYLLDGSGQDRHVA